MEPIYCHRTAQRPQPTPSSSFQGDPAQAVGAGISGGSCGQSAPNFPVGSVNGLSTVLRNGRSCINPFSTSPAPSLQPLPLGMQPPEPGLALAQGCPWGGLARVSPADRTFIRKQTGAEGLQHTLAPPHPSPVVMPAPGIRVFPKHQQWKPCSQDRSLPDLPGSAQHSFP